MERDPGAIPDQHPLFPAGAEQVSYRVLALAALRSLGVVAATLLVYALLPMKKESASAVAVFAAVGLLTILVVFVRQVMRISRAARPTLAAVEALCLVFGMFLALFALTYVSMSTSSPEAFTQPVDKLAGIYFSVTVLATVGFGDIAAVSSMARMAVTVQMVLDLVLIGSAVKILSMSARRAMAARTAHRTGATP